MLILQNGRILKTGTSDYADLHSKSALIKSGTNTLTFTGRRSCTRFDHLVIAPSIVVDGCTQVDNSHVIERLFAPFKTRHKFTSI